MRARRVVQEVERRGGALQDLPRLGILRVEEPERVLREPPRVLRAEPAGVRTDVLLQRLREVLARLPRRDAVERRDQVRQPERLQEAEEGDEDLRVARRRRRAHELEADLAELAVAAGLRLLVAELRTRVPEADRTGHVLEALLHQRAHDAGRVLRPQGQRPALAVRERVHLLVHDVGGVADRAGEEVRALEDRGADLGVAERAEYAPRRVLDRGEALADGREEVVRSLGRADPLAHRAHFPSTRKYSSL